MKLEDLTFVKSTPTTETITWNDKTFQVQIKPLSFGDVLDANQLEDSERQAALIQQGVILEGGQMLTADQVKQLNPSLALALLGAVAKVNALGQAPKA